MAFKRPSVRSRLAPPEKTRGYESNRSLFSFSQPLECQDGCQGFPSFSLLFFTDHPPAPEPPYPRTSPALIADGPLDSANHKPEGSQIIGKASQHDPLKRGLTVAVLTYGRHHEMLRAWYNCNPWKKSQTKY